MSTKIIEPFFERTKDLRKNLWDLRCSVVDYILSPSTCDLQEHISSAIDMHKRLVLTEAIERSMSLPEARWTYDNHFGLFTHKDDARLALVLPFAGHSKYILAKTKSGKEILAALPYDTHTKIATFIQDRIEERIGSILGGHIETTTKLFSNPTLTLYDSSDEYGETDYKEVSKLLNNAGLETKVRD